MLQFENVYIGFGSDREKDSLVKGLSFSLAKGEILAIVGESGSGKSLSVLSMNGLIAGAQILGGSMRFQSSEGTWYDLIRAEPSERRKILRHHMGYIFQEPMSALNPLMSCGKQVQERLSEKEPAQLKKNKVLEWFEKVKLPDPERIYNAYPHELSGGQRQRVMIAMALIHCPDLIIADEPTTALDASVQFEVISLLRTLVKEQGASMIIISHDLQVVRQIADQILVMYQGKTMEYSDAGHLFEQPESAYTRALLQVKPDLSSKGRYLPTLRDLTEMREGTMHTRAFQTIPWEKSARSEEDILNLSDVDVSYKSANGRIKILHHIKLSLKEGSSLGIIGESGSGKSTLVKAIIRLIEAEGILTLKGKNIQAWGKSYPNQVQMIFQDPYASLNPNQRIGDSIAEPLLVHGLAHNREDAYERVAQLMQDCGLNPEDAQKYPHQFSGGQRQRICIARALAMEPRLLLCDESVSALDVSVQAQILNLLKELQIKKGLSILFITHDLHVASWFCDEILVLFKGEVIESGPTEKVISHPESPYTLTLLKASGIY